MNGNTLFLLLVCSHVMGAIYLQPASLVIQRRHPASWFKPFILSVLPGYLLLLPHLTGSTFWIPLLMSMAWMVPEWIRTTNTERKSTPSHSHSFKLPFFASHLLPVIAAAVIAHFCTLNNAFPINRLWVPLTQAFTTLSPTVSFKTLLQWGLMFLLLGKPTNQVIRELNGKEKILQPTKMDPIPVLQASKRDPEYVNAGSLIGTLERLLIAIMMLLGQYAAIGLIFTAKSITRYDRISKDPSFAEYYLVGTLMSALFAIVIVLGLKPV